MADWTADAEAVVVGERPGSNASPVVLLDRALEQAGLWCLAQERLRSSTDADAIVLVDLGGFELDAPVNTRVDLVEHLLDGLADRGWRRLAVAAGPDSSQGWAENRDVVVLADLFGYTYRTPKGAPYDVVDLSEDLADAGFPAGSVLAGSTLARAWLNAGLRIVFGKCKTDQRDVVALGLQCLTRVLPLADKDYFYRHRVDAAEALALLLDRAPPHFALIDACDAAHGSGGTQVSRCIATRAVAAGVDIVAVDCTTAAALGADPADSRLIAGVVRRLGRTLIPAAQAPLFEGFLLPDPLLVDSTRAREADLTMSRLVAPWLQHTDTTLFPFRHPLDARANAQVARRFKALDDEPAERAMLVGLNYLCAYAGNTLQLSQLFGDKNAIMRRVAGISPATLACTDDDYRAMERELLALRDWLRAQPAPPGPLHWRYLGRAVVFTYERVFPVPFEEFVRQIDVARTIQYMNDYVGGTLLPVERDGQGRPIRQVERNLYLAQPNYMALWGGKEIDVSKIESVHYEPRLHRMFWKTIASENGSAAADDGIVTCEAGERGTRVEIFGRQLFTLPPMLESAGLDRFPAVRDPMVTHAYLDFFARTMANFDALLEGRDIAIGRPWHSPTKAREHPPRPVELLARRLSRCAEAAAPLLERVGRTWVRPVARARVPSAIRDKHGFVHQVAASSPAQQAVPPSPFAEMGRFLAGYIEAVGRDLAGLGGLSGRGRERDVGDR